MCLLNISKPWACICYYISFHSSVRAFHKILESVCSIQPQEHWWRWALMLGNKTWLTFGFKFITVVWKALLNWKYESIYIMQRKYVVKSRWKVFFFRESNWSDIWILLSLNASSCDPIQKYYLLWKGFISKSDVIFTSTSHNLSINEVQVCSGWDKSAVLSL